MPNFLLESASFLFTDIGMILCAVLCFVLSVSKRTKFPALRWIFIYPLATIVETILGWSIYFNWIQEDEYSLMINVSVNAFLIVEFLSLFVVFRGSTYSKSPFSKWKVILALYFFSLLVFWFKAGTINIYPDAFFVIQAFFVLILAFEHWLEMLNKSSNIGLSASPSIWITIGASVYFLSTLPLFLARKIVLDSEGFISEKALYSINYICYSILFVFIGRAFLCKPKSIRTI
jgi:hypothetical protein